MNGRTEISLNMFVNPQVHKVQDLMEAFQSVPDNLVLDDGDDPDSLMSEVIKKASKFVVNSCRHNYSKYYVLLIITDGVLLGVQKTIDSLVDASILPMSFLIVNVGDSISFESLKVVVNFF